MAVGLPLVFGLHQRHNSHVSQSERAGSHPRGVLYATDLFREQLLPFLELKGVLLDDVVRIGGPGEPVYAWSRSSPARKGVAIAAVAVGWS